MNFYAIFPLSMTAAGFELRVVSPQLYHFAGPVLFDSIKDSLLSSLTVTFYYYKKQRKVNLVRKGMKNIVLSLE
jgi:hypothetical protein